MGGALARVARLVDGSLMPPIASIHQQQLSGSLQLRSDGEPTSLSSCESKSANACRSDGSVTGMADSRTVYSQCVSAKADPGRFK